MKELIGKVAVVTGAASGIGQALATLAAHNKMRVVIADVAFDELKDTEELLISEQVDVLAVRADVSQPEEVRELARKTLEAFGAVHLLFNNAGVAPNAAGKQLWEIPLEIWQHAVGVNLWGVVHGIREFLPIMLSQNTECHVVNTASVAGLISGEFGIYAMTKHAVVAISEGLYCSLERDNAKVHVSVLCPGLVQTRISESREPNAVPLTQEQNDARYAKISEDLGRYGKVLSATQVAEIAFEAIYENRFYILTHQEWNDLIADRMNAIINGMDPKEISH